MGRRPLNPPHAHENETAAAMAAVFLQKWEKGLRSFVAGRARGAYTSG
jgi:hypothetical protein